MFICKEGYACEDQGVEEDKFLRFECLSNEHTTGASWQFVDKDGLEQTKKGRYACQMKSCGSIEETTWYQNSQRAFYDTLFDFQEEEEEEGDPWWNQFDCKVKTHIFNQKRRPNNKNRPECIPKAEAMELECEDSWIEPKQKEVFGCAYPLWHDNSRNALLLGGQGDVTLEPYMEYKAAQLWAYEFKEPHMIWSAESIGKGKKEDARALKVKDVDECAKKWKEENDDELSADACTLTAEKIWEERDNHKQALEDYNQKGVGALNIPVEVRSAWWEMQTCTKVKDGNAETKRCALALREMQHTQHVQEWLNENRQKKQTPQFYLSLEGDKPHLVVKFIEVNNHDFTADEDKKNVPLVTFGNI